MKVLAPTLQDLRMKKDKDTNKYSLMKRIALQIKVFGGLAKTEAEVADFLKAIVIYRPRIAVMLAPHRGGNGRRHLGRVRPSRQYAVLRCDGVDLAGRCAGSFRSEKSDADGTHAICKNFGQQIQGMRNGGRW